MKPHDLEFLSITTFPAGQTLARVQRIRTTRETRPSLRISGFLLPPPGLLSGRFDLPDEAACYLAEAPETALYEALARREARELSFATVAQRTLLTVETRRPLSVADLRPHARHYPVLQSLRFNETQELALAIRAQGCDGILYRSAQQAGADCWVLWGDAIKTCRITRRQPLVDPDSGGLHRHLASALRGSRIPLCP
ncbi:RES family NAD+ phosphorylase [Derxia gummosa]|uniref:RES family NAD+ phosphorylase n=1 Tax=Derxia gummosa DSM 723 TaxID=1121388 RepID=A0A8B6X1I7_9BURK|nr:RES family NAD+ phosphorylase [Derxia gummosa]